MFNWFFSPEYCTVLFYILIGFAAVFVLLRFICPWLKPWLESKIIALSKKKKGVSDASDD